MFKECCNTSSLASELLQKLSILLQMLIELVVLQYIYLKIKNALISLIQTVEVSKTYVLCLSAAITCT